MASDARVILSSAIFIDKARIQSLGENHLRAEMAR
jgi:hypothetical protein